MTSPFDIVAEISAVLDELGIPYVLGRSVASSLVGEPRTTVDVDFAVRLRPDELAGLAARVADSYYLPPSAWRISSPLHALTLRPEPMGGAGLWFRRGAVVRWPPSA